jgi:uncharacterized RDD family membrane protein YckC
VVNEALQFSHSGSRYLLGFGQTFFGIWDRQAPGDPVERFPRTDEGWRQAWLRYISIEPSHVEVGMGPSRGERPGASGSTAPSAAVALASPWARLAARLVDGLVMAVVFTALTAGGVIEADLTRPQEVSTTFIAMALVVTVLYETIFVGLRGQTPGKMVLRITVVRVESGGLPGWGRALTRAVLPAVANLVPFGGLIVYAWLLWDPRRQGLHDKLAQTLVISGQPVSAGRETSS